MKLLAICFSLLSLVTAAVIKNRPDVLVSRQFLSKYLPINHEIPLVLSAVNVGDEPAYDVTLVLLRHSNITGPFFIKGSLIAKYAKIEPKETVQHVVRVTLTRNPFGVAGEEADNKVYMNIAGAPARVIYRGKNGQTYVGTSTVTQDMIPTMVLESVAQKFVGTNCHYWLVFSGMMFVTILIPLLQVCSFKNKYDEAKKPRVKKVGSDDDETNSSDNDGSSKTKESSPKQFYTATEVLKKKKKVRKE